MPETEDDLREKLAKAKAVARSRQDRYDEARRYANDEKHFWHEAEDEVDRLEKLLSETAENREKA